VELWRYVLECDRQVDLTKPAGGRDWFRGLPEVVTGLTAPRAWSRTAGEEWARCIHALRFLTERLNNYQPARPAQIDSLTADGVANRYVKELHVSLYDEAAERRELTASNFVGLRVQSPRTPTTPAPEFTAFFQRVFGSLFSPAVEPICGVCAKPLPPTAGGRPSRRETCKACQQAKAWAQKPQNDKRRVWNQQYRKHRSAAARAKSANNTDTKG
jgi:hypothetical protein